MKKVFKRENLLVFLLVGLFGHNFYLQLRIDRAIEAAEYAGYEARSADSNAIDAARNARDAVDYASDAADYAREAAEKAFGNECWSCP